MMFVNLKMLRKEGVISMQNFVAGRSIEKKQNVLEKNKKQKENNQLLKNLKDQ